MGAFNDSRGRRYIAPTCVPASAGAIVEIFDPNWDKIPAIMLDGVAVPLERLLHRSVILIQKELTSWP